LSGDHPAGGIFVMEQFGEGGYSRLRIQITSRHGYDSSGLIPTIYIEDRDGGLGHGLWWTGGNAIWPTGTPLVLGLGLGFGSSANAKKSESQK
jgi:hypothetical protein